MNKIYNRLASAIIFSVLSTTINAQIISDNFDSYETGPLSPQAIHWTTWSGSSEDDGNIVNTVSNSEPNSLLIENNTVNTNMLLLLGNKNAGSYSLDYTLFIPSGKSGYYNFQEDELPGFANLDVFFNIDGLSPGIGSFDQLDSAFTYPENEWFTIHQVIDLDADLMSFWINGDLVFDNFVFNGNLGSLNFTAFSDINELYIDDVVFDEAEALSPCSFPTIICDNFDSYDPGVLGPQSDHWSTWSGNEGGPDEGLVVTDQFYSTPNSMFVGNNGTQDVLLLLGNQTTGTYSIDFMAYLPADAEGYFNIQENEQPGNGWNLEVWFNRNGAAPGVGSFAATNPDTTFAFPHDTWFPIKMVIDLDANVMDFYADGVLAFQNFVYLGNIGAIDIFSGSDINSFYIDDVIFDEAESLSDCDFPTYICDNFDSYNVGGLGEQAPWWSTWSGELNTPEDGIVTTSQANSPPNSLYIGNNGTQDVLLLLGNNTEGSYSISFNVYIPSDKEGFFNIQEDEEPGVAWNLEIFFNKDGENPGVGNFPGYSEATFTYPENEWFNVKVFISLDDDLLFFLLNSEYVMTIEYFGNIGAVDFFSFSENNMMYIDDVIFQDDFFIYVQELNNLDGFKLFPNPGNGKFTITSEKLFGQFNLDLIDITGRIVYSERIDLSINEKKMIDTGILQTGVYILRMVDQTTSEIYTTRVLIQKN